MDMHRVLHEVEWYLYVLLFDAVKSGLEAVTCPQDLDFVVQRRCSLVADFSDSRDNIFQIYHLSVANRWVFIYCVYLSFRNRPAVQAQFPLCLSVSLKIFEIPDDSLCTYTNEKNVSIWQIASFTSFPKKRWSYIHAFRVGLNNWVPCICRIKGNGRGKMWVSEKWA